MKKILFFLAIILLNTNWSNAQGVYHDTQGQVDVSNGQATYTLPIAVPPTLHDFAPTV